MVAHLNLHDPRFLLSEHFAGTHGTSHHSRRSAIIECPCARIMTLYGNIQLPSRDFRGFPFCNSSPASTDGLRLDEEIVRFGQEEAVRFGQEEPVGFDVGMATMERPFAFKQALDDLEHNSCGKM